MNIYHENLKKIVSEKKLVTLYTDFFDESFIGFIIKFSDELLLLQSYETGTYDGIKVISLDDITRIRWGSNELTAIRTLIADETISNHTDLLAINIDTKIHAMTSIQKHFGYINVYTQKLDKNICFIGEMLEYDKESIVLYEFGTLESDCGSSMLFALQDITRIDADGMYEKQLVQIKKQLEKTASRIDRKR